MAVDFYFRNEQDPNFIPNVYEVKDELENTIQQVRMTILTKKGEVLGEPEFGFGMEKYLFEFEGFEVGAMEQEVNTLVQDYVLNSRKYGIGISVAYLDDLADPYKTGLALDVKIDGSKSVFAALYDL
jgi:hypothetical protein